MTDITAVITHTLGVSTPAATLDICHVRDVFDTCPPRPDAMYAWTVYTTRSEYGSVVVIATNRDEAHDLYAFDDINWHDSGHIETDEIEQSLPANIVNKHELEQWDATYATSYEHDGTRK